MQLLVQSDHVGEQENLLLCSLVTNEMKSPGISGGPSKCCPRVSQCMPYKRPAREEYAAYTLEKSARKIIMSNLTAGKISICSLS